MLNLTNTNSSRNNNNNNNNNNSNRIRQSMQTWTSSAIWPTSRPCRRSRRRRRPLQTTATQSPTNRISISNSSSSSSFIHTTSSNNRNSWASAQCSRFIFRLVDRWVAVAVWATCYRQLVARQPRCPAHRRQLTSTWRRASLPRPLRLRCPTSRCRPHPTRPRPIRATPAAPARRGWWWWCRRQLSSWLLSNINNNNNNSSSSSSSWRIPTPSRPTHIQPSSRSRPINSSNNTFSTSTTAISTATTTPTCTAFRICSKRPHSYPPPTRSSQPRQSTAIQTK